MQIEFLVSFIVYLLTILIIGIVSSKKNQSNNLPSNSKDSNSNDFILGSRSSNWLLTALSAHAADMSDWLFMGLPGAIYTNGALEIWIPIGLLFGMFLSWHFIAAKLRIESEKYNANTLASYFQNRFNDRSGIIVSISALISFFFFTIYLSVGIKGIGYVLKSAFNFNYYFSTLLAVIIVVIYTLIGGFVSVAYIDLFQGIFLLLMLMLVPIYAFIKLGNISCIMKAAKIKNISLSLIPSKYESTIKNLAFIVLNPFSWCLGYFGMPHILTKFMAAKNPQDMNKSKYFGLTWQLLATSSAVAVGLIGLCYFQAVPNKPEFIFIEMTKCLFTPWLAGIVLCAILAATISTVDSQLLVIASIIAQDFYKNLINKNATEKQVYNIYQISLIISALIGLIIAWQENNSIMSLVKYAWSGLGSSFGPALVLSLYSKKINKWGIIASIIIGCSTSMIWPLINKYITNIEIYSIAPAFILSIIACYIVSFITKNYK
ncbi:sodium/proline symporter [Candidatus Babela massiliensis]|uniref:Sodium/proline symporter n=1 Tax=Candidatus Babela massiliensis TaxID=673862 RepID=V6DG73_9BACT|nr:sodium/proline symporter [Candidatus Babela massiliensis]CDK30560.1 Na+/proline symporter [Candidatus Babela massiliensis]